MVPPSICIGKSMVETTYQLYVSIVYGKQQSIHNAPFPVRIKRYDTLSTFGAFRVPIVKSQRSTDHYVTLDYSIPGSSFGPTDSINAFIRVSPNPDWLSKSKKVKLQRVTMQVVEVITFNQDSEESIEKQRQVCKTSQQFDSKLGELGCTCDLSLEFPAVDLSDKEGIVGKERLEIPLVSRNGGTTTASLYKIEYYLVVKARLSHSKDIEIRHPIVITPFNHATCMSFMKSISEAVDFANISDKQVTMRPRVYFAKDPNSLWQLAKVTQGVKGYTLLIN